MKKTILYAIAAISIAAIAALAIIGCNNGDNSDSEGLNKFLGSLVNRDPGGDNVDSGDGGDPKPTEYTLTANSNLPDGGDVEPSQGSYASGTTVYVTATAKKNYTFINWSGSASGNTNPIPIVMDGHKTITAIFAPEGTTLVTVRFNSNGGGTPPDDIKGGEGSTITLPREGNMEKSCHKFSGWTSNSSDEKAEYGPGSSYSIQGQKDVTLYAVWTITTYKLETKVVGDGEITRNPSGETYNCGAQVTLTAKPADGWNFAGWTGASGSDNKATITMDGNKTVTANFTKAAQTQTYYKLSTSVSPDKSGSVSLYPEQLKEGYASGANVKATATAESEYEFTGWSGASTAKEQSVTITMDRAKTLTANFKAKGSTGPTTKPSAPTNVTAEMTSASSIIVKWDAVSNATGYVVYRSRTNVVYTQVGYVDGGTVVSYADNRVTKGLGYYYKVSARNSSGESDKSSSISIAMVDDDQKCGTYCLWGGGAGCTDLVADPTGNYNSNDYWPPLPTPTCDSAETRCIRDGAGLYDNPTCTGNNLGGVLKNEFCNKYCIWNYACSELKTDRNGVYGGSIDNCANAITVCENYSTPGRTFDSMEECVRIGKDKGWYKDPGDRSAALLKSRASSLRAIYTNGTVEAALTLPAAPKLSGGSAELIDDKSGATVSSAPVKISGKKVTAVLDASAVPSGYYTVRVVLINKDGGRSVEEASIGIVK